jgi:predicted metal-dependent hydrolase
MKQPDSIVHVQVIRSRKRRRTISARLKKDTMYVYAPLAASEAYLEKVITNFKERFQRQLLRRELNRTEDIQSAAARLNEKYFEGKSAFVSIEYVVNQTSKYGCCNYRTREIRISHRIAAMPAWVRDYVLVHELAHLIEPNHSRAFWELVARYPLAERARGFLIAKGLEEAGEDEVT